MPVEPALPAEAASTGGPLGNLVADHLRRVEVAMLGRILTTTLVGALPASMVRVERRRSLLDRLFRRPGVVLGVSVLSADQALTFRSPAVGVTEARVGRVVGGVVLSSEAVPVAEWLTLLGDLLTRASAADEATRIALERGLLQ
ncbi:MAG: hypothetical protein JWQ77_3276 [Jatrophihabitans sp.]|nr:hypothetical protein [Jatrophihabitans sp.]